MDSVDKNATANYEIESYTGRRERYYRESVLQCALRRGGDLCVRALLEFDVDTSVLEDSDDDSDSDSDSDSESTVDIHPLVEEHRLRSVNEQSNHKVLCFVRF